MIFFTLAVLNRPFFELFEMADHRIDHFSEFLTALTMAQLLRDTSYRAEKVTFG